MGARDGQMKYTLNRDLIEYQLRGIQERGHKNTKGFIF
jgi:hypothetical protein